MSYVLDWIFDNRWAIKAEALEAILSIADRDDVLQLAQQSPEELQIAFHVDPAAEDKTALEALDSDRLDGTYNVGMRDGIAVIPVVGPIVPRSSFFARMSGMASVATLAKDFNTAVESRDVKAIVLNIDSPGGVITGIAEFGDMLFAAQKVKPVVSYGYGLVASAAYWLGSATSEIVIGETAEAGSIGVVAAYTDFSKSDEKRGIQRLEIVSSVSPNKRPNVFTDEGRRQVQQIVDDLAGIFVKTVARNRGVDEEAVRGNFGKGGVLVGQNAVDAGLVDRIGSLESLITELQGSPTTTFLVGGNEMSLTLETLRADSPEVYRAAVQVGRDAVSQEQTEAHTAAVDTARTEGATAERERIQGIEALTAPGFETVIADSKFKPEATADSVARLVLDAQAENAKKTGDNQKADGEDLAGKLSGVDAAEGTGKGDADAAEEKAAVEEIAAGANE
jgi:signal peptide peptidase SppA